MSISVNIPWVKYGLIVELAKRLENVSPQFGKTAVQKLVFLLEEHYGVPCDYEYSLYTYGPYCAELAADVEYIASMGGVNLNQVFNGGYDIRIGDNARLISEKSKDFIEKYSSQIDRLISDFGQYNARDLELRSTLIYLGNRQRYNKTELKNDLIDLKPYFSGKEVSDAINELVKGGFIKTV